MTVSGFKFQVARVLESNGLRIRLKLSALDSRTSQITHQSTKAFCLSEGRRH